MTHAYSTLGVHRHSTDAEVRTAYHAAARVHHPDKGGAEEVMADINLAFANISTGTRRYNHDRLLRLCHPECQTCRGEGVRWQSVGFTKRTANLCGDCKGAGVRVGTRL